MKLNKITIIFYVLFVLSACSINEKLNYRFLSDDLCNDKNGLPINFITIADINKHHGKTYDEKTTEVNDSVIIQFKKIDYCCLQPKDSLIIKGDKMIIVPAFISPPEGCDCFCDYLFEYRFSKNDLNRMKISIKNPR